VETTALASSPLRDWQRRGLGRGGKDKLLSSNTKTSHVNSASSIPQEGRTLNRNDKPAISNRGKENGRMKHEGNSQQGGRKSRINSSDINKEEYTKEQCSILVQSQCTLLRREKKIEEKVKKNPPSWHPEYISKRCFNVVKTPYPMRFNVCKQCNKETNTQLVRLLARHDIDVSSTLLLATLDSGLLATCAGRPAEQVVETACVA